MCTIKITSVTGTESGGQVTSVRVEGKAEGCSQIKVSFTCQGNIITKVVPADPGGGEWKAVFDASDNLVVAECECDGPVRVEAVCEEDAACMDTWEGKLECDDDRRCEVKITAVLGTEAGGQVTSVTVLGKAAGCSQVKVSFTCQGQVISEAAAVDAGGNWKAVFDAADQLALAECQCDGPVRVEAVCADHPDCSDRWEGKLDCEEERRCEIKITSVTGTESGGQVTSVTVEGKADGCDVVNVSFTCQGQVIAEVAPVDPLSGTWKAVFDAADKLVLAECECDGPVRVEAVCVDHPNCADRWEGRLECEGDEEPCEIKITSVKGEAAGGQVTTVIVEGKAANCSKVEVSFTCRGQVISETVAVNADGTWKAVFDDDDKIGVAECECGGPVQVRAVCVDDPECVDKWEGKLDCDDTTTTTTTKPPTTTTTTTRPTTTTTTTQGGGGGLCGILSLAFLLVFASVLLLIFSSPTTGLIAAGLAVTCLLVGVLAPGAPK